MALTASLFLSPDSGSDTLHMTPGDLDCKSLCEEEEAGSASAMPGTLSPLLSQWRLQASHFSGPGSFITWGVPPQKVIFIKYLGAVCLLYEGDGTVSI